jgi:uncharacterized protein YciI
MADRMTSEQAVAAARSHGFAAHQLFVVFSYAVDGVAPIFANSEPHLAHQIALEREGVMFGAGPLLSAEGPWFDGDGMIVLRAPSLEAARAIAERDPMHVSGARRFEIRPWIVNEGSISVTVSLSDGRGRLESAPANPAV